MCVYERSILLKEIKVNSTLVILIATLLFLFAGHFIYQSHFIERPLRTILNSLPNATLKHVILQPKNVRIIIGTTPGFSLKEYPVLIEKIERIVGPRNIEVRVIDQPNEVLEAAWQKMTFGVQEGLIQNKFTQVNDTVTSIAKESNVKSLVLMDERYILIELRHKNNYLLKVYSLNKAMNEVKD